MLTGRFMLRALRRWWLLPLCALPLGAGAWLLAPRGIPVRWTAETRVHVNPPETGLPPSVRLPDPHAVWNAPETALKAGTQLAAALKRKPGEAPGFAERLSRGIRVEINPDSVRVVSEAEDEAVAAAHALVYARAACEAAGERRDQALSAALTEAARRAKAALQKADALLPDDAGAEGRFREGERRLAALNAAALEIERQIEGVRAREDRTLARIRILEGDEHRLRELLPSGPEEDGLKSPVLDKIRGEIAAVRTEMALKGYDRAPDSPEARIRTARLGELEQALRLELHRVRSQTIVALRESMTELESELRTLDERRLRKALEIRDIADDLQAAGVRRTEAAALRREAETREEERLKIAGFLETKPAPPLVPGVLAGDPVPSAGRAGGFRSAWIGIGVGLLLGLSTALLWEGMTGRVHSGRDVRRLLDLPCLAVLERAADPLAFRSQGSAAESYGMAATLLRAYLAERNYKVILVSSAGAGEGKSSVAASLAGTLARKGMKVALLDADLRRPCQHELFGVDNAQGLSNILTGAELDAELAAGTTEVPGLRLLPSGPTQDVAPDSLESPRLEELLKALRGAHDVVIIDGPPLTGASEALALARLADTVLFVIRAGCTDPGRLHWARQLLSNLHADIAGAVVTMAAGSDVRRYTPAA